jgi:hypothetical protein
VDGSGGQERGRGMVDDDVPMRRFGCSIYSGAA